jgi:phage shock protein PspC (stress-responsive transcriptional regulator)
VASTLLVFTLISYVIEAACAPPASSPGAAQWPRL